MKYNFVAPLMVEAKFGEDPAFETLSFPKIF